MLSMSDTTPAAPLSRSHSTARTPNETFEGAVIALHERHHEIEQQDQRGEDDDPSCAEPKRAASRTRSDPRRRSDVRGFPRDSRLRS